MSTTTQQTSRSYIGNTYPTCWAFVRDWYARELGIKLGGVPVDSDLMPVDTPADNDIVLIHTRYRYGHCGIWLRGGILHVYGAQGVVYEKRLGLPYDIVRPRSTHN